MAPEIAGLEDLVEVGRGGFAIVYRARQAAFDRDVAVKIITTLGLDDSGRQRFARECAATGRLSWHPNVVQVYDQGTTTDGHPYLVQEYLEAGSLGALLRRSGALPWPQALRYATQLASALAAAHDAGLLHRDIKPDNVLLDRMDNAKLADFGIAGVADSTLTATGMVPASVAYAAPEIFTGATPTVASDIYSLGATLHALLTGQRPHQGESDDNIVATILKASTEPLPDLRPHNIPDPLARIVEQATAKDPAERYTDAASMQLALRAIDDRSASLPYVIPNAPDVQEADGPAVPSDTTATVLRPRAENDRTRIVTDSPRPGVPRTDRLTVTPDTGDDLAETAVRPYTTSPEPYSHVTVARSATGTPAEIDTEPVEGNSGGDRRVPRETRLRLIPPAFVLALGLIGGLVIWLSQPAGDTDEARSDPEPTSATPEQLLEGTWYRTDDDGSTQRIRITQFTNDRFEIRYFDTPPNICIDDSSFVSSGTGLLVDIPDAPSAADGGDSSGSSYEVLATLGGNLERECSGSPGFGTGALYLQVLSNGWMLAVEPGVSLADTCFTRTPEDSC